MDCKLAELLMMQHFEKTIEPPEANKLAKHVLTCETCRELYLLLDESMDEAESLDVFDKGFLPIDFTESVMVKVRELPTYSKPKVAEVAITDTSSGQVVLRVLWGMSAIVLGAILWLTSWEEMPPVVDSIVYALTTAGTAVVGAFESIGQDIASSSAGNLSIIALLFVAVMGTLLYVLHNGEKSIET